MDGLVLVRMRAASVNALDWHTSAFIVFPWASVLSACFPARPPAVRSRDPPKTANRLLFLISNDGGFVDGSAIVADVGWTAM